MGIEEEESIEAAAAARRERLRALRAAQELLNTPDQDDQGSGAEHRPNGVQSADREADEEEEEEEK